MASNVQRAQSIVGYKPEGRPELDFYPTPENATLALLEKEDFPGTVWECACGDGAIARVFKDHGYPVVASDIADYGYGVHADFLNTWGVDADSIVTNPPFSLLYEFIYHAMELKRTKKLAIFGKLQALEGDKRSKLLERTHLARVHVFRKRLTLSRNGEDIKNRGMIAFAWFVWEKGYMFKPTIDWI